MKTIFIATDFSPAAHNATLYGVELANMLNAKIVLFNAYTVPLSVPESYSVVNPDEVKRAAEMYLEDERVLIKSRVLNNNVQVMSDEGPATETILKNAANCEEVIIVTGMKGEGRNIRKWFGSTASGLARSTSYPLFIVPEDAAFTSLKKIALGLEYDFDTELKALETLKEVGMRFESKIYLMKVVSFRTHEVDELASRSKYLMNSMKPLDTEYKFQKAEDVNTGINDFISENNIDLFCVMPKHQNLIERIFVRSETRKLIFHSHIPLFILPESATEKEMKKSSPAEKQISSMIS
jgi:nucleotide-binding universal stress UspA family protein